MSLSVHFYYRSRSVGPANLGCRRQSWRRFGYAVAFLLAAGVCAAQQQPQHVIGTVTAVDKANQTVTFKQDKTGTEYVGQLANTKTILSVPPGTKPADLKNVAKRITSAEIQPGDRIEVYYLPSAMNGNTIAARAAVLMSARSLEAVHTAEAQAWQHSTVGLVSSVDANTHTLNINVRTAEGSKPVTVTSTDSTQFTRYSEQDPKTPAPSKLADIQPGDTVRVVGEKSADQAAISAQRIYLAPRQLPAVIVSSAGNELTVKDLRNKQNVVVAVNSRTQVRRLPPQIAYMLARRLNPNFRAAAGGGDHAGAPPSGARPGAAGGANESRSVGAPANRAPGDLSRLIEHAPEVQISDLKPGDAVVISGVSQTGGQVQLLANTILAGVEPIFQSAPPRSGESLGNWSLDMSGPAPEE